jgi:MoaA/NifB/PqqE/SkfB family radical SAM enzyme
MRKYSIDLVKGKRIVLWGARMTGLGALRRISAEGGTVSFFVDSDKALQGKSLQKRRIVSPSDCVQKYITGDFDIIVITAVLKAADIYEAILSAYEGHNRPEVFVYGNSDTPSVTIDVLGTCNLKCSSCAHSIPNHRVPKGSMSFGTFERVLDKAVLDNPDLSHISLYSWGDPLLHPHLAKIVDYTHSKNIAVAISSNLSINLDGKLDAVINSNPDYFKVSVSGYSQSIYESTHQGGDINLVKSNLYKVRYLMNKYNRDFLVDINYHLYRNNHGAELESFRRLAADLDFTLSTTFSLVMPLERVIAYLDGNPDYNTTLLNDDYLLVDIREGIAAAGGKGLPVRDCPYLHNQININADLSVPLCCLTFERTDRTIVAENYLQTSPEQIVRSKLEKTICARCQKEGLPEYNLGNRQKNWETIAIKKGMHPKEASN